MFIKIGNSDFWVDKIEWNLDLKNEDLGRPPKCFLFVLLICWRPITLLRSNSVKKRVIIMSITVIKCINRYGCGLFNSCCGMKITFFCICIGFKQSSFIVLMKKALAMISWKFLHTFDKQDFPYFATNCWKIPGITQLNSWKQKWKWLLGSIWILRQGKGKMVEKWLQENVNISPKITVSSENFL